MHNLKVLIVCDWYLPAYKAGGPVRSLANMVSGLAESGFEFYVLTRDRDLRDAGPYPGVPLETWTKVSGAYVFYTANHSLMNFLYRIKEIKPDVLYLNSFFSTFSRNILLLRRFGLLDSTVVTLAPRGELAPGALRIKWHKKGLYIRIAALTGLYRNLLWHATSAEEKAEISEHLLHHRLVNVDSQISGSIYVASNMPTFGTPLREPRLDKHPGKVNFVAISRVAPIKNLAFAIELLASIRGEIKFHIYGLMDDPGYWHRCEQLIAQLPANVEVRYLGPIPYEEVQKRISQYHFLLLPTYNENFGHAIAESLAAGCPVMISDCTPWSRLIQKNVGWDLPLNDRSSWLNALQRCADMDSPTYTQMSCASLHFFSQWAHLTEARVSSVELFRWAFCRRSRSETEEQTWREQNGE